MQSEHEEFARLIAEARDLVTDLRAILCQAQATPHSSTSPVDKAIDRLILDGCKSRIMKLDRELIVQVAERLLQPGATVTETTAWLCGELGRQLSAKTVYRFRELFVTAYERVTGVGRPPEPVDVAVRAVAQWKRRSDSKLVNSLSDELLIELARLITSHRATALRGWLERRIGRKVNPMQFGRLYHGLDGTLRNLRKPPHLTDTLT